MVRRAFRRTFPAKEVKGALKKRNARYGDIEDSSPW